jgi:succinate dehydrogenase / fumarate reductase cytochrome b subunit
MASATAGPIRPKGPPRIEPTGRALPFLSALLDSSVGAKLVVALTGLGLTLFTVFHMVGNLKVFQGPAAVNGYADFLKHDLGILIWVARAGLLGLFALHLFLALRLHSRTLAARPVPYRYHATVQASAASRSMVLSGVVVGLFVLFHLAHYTFGWVKGAEVEPGKVVNYLDLRYKMPSGVEVHDVYSMVVAGFTTPWVVALYTVAQVVFFLHLLHGVQSSFQTLGLKNRRFAPSIRTLGFLVAAAVVGGNLLIVYGVLAGWAPPLYPKAG